VITNPYRTFGREFALKVDDQLRLLIGPSLELRRMQLVINEA
jgi:hypothetical protein